MSLKFICNSDANTDLATCQWCKKKITSQHVIPDADSMLKKYCGLFGYMRKKIPKMLEVLDATKISTIDLPYTGLQFWAPVPTGQHIVEVETETYDPNIGIPASTPTLATISTVFSNPGHSLPNIARHSQNGVKINIVF